MKRIISLLLLAQCMLTASAQGIYDFTVKDDFGREVSLSRFRGQVVLIVNTATRCGFTPQYEELEALYEKYHAEGLEILDFPCNQFGAQAPGTIQEIHEFCTQQFDIHFPQFDKIEVNGPGAHPLYTYLKEQKGFGGFDLGNPTGKMLDEMFRKQDADYASKPDIKWNFTKFLVGRDGRVLRRYEPTDKMSLVGADIQAALNPVVANIMQRRSIRRYKDQPVEHEKLQTLVRCGINAPSGMNRQPWLLRVVEDQNLIGRVNDVFVKANPEQVKREPGFKNMFRNAPNIICVCTPTDGSGQLDAGLLTENILLAAQSMGLGTCCLGGPVRFLNTNPDARFFLEQMEVPSDYQLTLVIAVGYPDEQPEARPRDESKVKFITE